MGYDPVFIHEALPSLLNSFCGVGNPFALGGIQPGYNVLDIGSGVGFDLYIAKRLTGESGKVCGIDLTREMVDRARKSLADSGMNTIDVTHVSSEKFHIKTGHLIQ